MLILLMCLFVRVHETNEENVSHLEKELIDTKLVIHNLSTMFTVVHDRDELEQLTDKIQQLNSTIKQQEKKLHKAGTFYHFLKML